ncbi:MAG: cytochrome P450 family protein [Sporichthyaceae bacterium]
MTSDVQDALGNWGGFDLDNPFPLFAAVREQAPVHRITLADGHTAWLIVRYDEARAALNDTRLSKDMSAALSEGEVVAEGLPGAALARHMLAMDPPDHTRLRKLVASAFTPRRVESLRPRVQLLVDDLLDDIAAAGPETPVDFVSTFAFPLPYTVICELLGIPEPDRAALGSAFTDLFLPGDGGEPPAAAKAGAQHIIEYLDHVVGLKRTEPGDDLISALVTAQSDGASLTHRELCSTLFQLFVAGHDTTASLIGNGLVALLTHPDQLKALRSDPALLQSAIEEMLRFDAPVPHSTFRYSNTDTEIGGVTIPAGEQVIISLAAANRDPERFSGPELFDVARSQRSEDRRHIAFGHGIHFCLGAPLGRMEGEVAFGTLLARFPDFRLAVDPSELRWSHGDGLVLRGLAALPIVAGAALPR